MSEIPIINFIFLFFIIATSIIAGISTSLFMPWTNKAYNSSLPFSFGIALSPFMLGFGSIFAFGIFQKYSHSTHLFIVIFFLLAVALLNIYKVYGYFSQLRFSIKKLSWQESLVLFCLLLWVLFLLMNALFFPITKNDALEYATVGKVLYEGRSLLSYPVIDSTNVNSGFYGPWTHPPLYVALIYIMNIIQGSADNPVFMKLISPWFVIGSILLMYEIGKAFVNRKTGLLNSLIFLSSPLYFLGASDSLIDPLPVLGIILILCTIIFFNPNLRADSLAKGFILGIALWTHSEAILFIPLMLVGILAYNGLKNVNHSLITFSISLSTALLLSSYAYVRNYLLFQSIISDTPLVFSLPQLDWPTYFQLNRSYFTFLEKIQCGVLKGWVVIDAYSLIFWLMTLGIFFFFKDVKYKYFIQLINGEYNTGFPFKLRVMFSFLSIFACYICGVILSIILNVDLMIRNERYLLIMLPIAAFFAGTALNQITTFAVTSRASRKEKKVV